MPEDFFNYADFYTYVSSFANFNSFVEVGVYTGASCAFLTRKLVERKTPFQMFAVDLWDKVNTETDYDRKIDTSVLDAFTERMTKADLLRYVLPMQMESAKAAGMFKHPVDFVFIDASHTYEHVKADIEAWRSKIRRGGMLAGHDYGEPCGVKQAVDELIGDNISLMGTCWYTIIK